MDDVDVLQTLADQVAVAIENARLLDESQAALMQLEAVTNFRTREAWGQRLQKQVSCLHLYPSGITRRCNIPEEERSCSELYPFRYAGKKLATYRYPAKTTRSWNKVDEELITRSCPSGGARRRQYSPA